MSSSSANSVETMRLFNNSNWNKSNNNDSESIENYKHKETDSDKEYKTKRYIKQKDTTEEKPEVKSKKNNPFTYQLKKKFKEDSVQPPNLRGEIEHKNAIEKACKIDKISYTFDLEDKLVCNKIENLDTNGNNFKLLCIVNLSASFLLMIDIYKEKLR